MKKLTKEQIQEFADSWEEAFNQRLTPEEAEFEFNKLMRFLKLISRPIPPGPTPPGGWPLEDLDPPTPEWP